MGMSFLLDAEQFNYGYQEEYGVGFKMALHDHRDKPMLKLSSELINVGTITQINVKPEITYTTKSAIEMFAPDERECYDTNEANLTYLEYDRGFRYSMDNCLIDRVIHEIIWTCQCLPSFLAPKYVQFLQKSLF